MEVRCVDVLYQPRSDVIVVNKQLNDKERVAAALENPALVEALEVCLQSAWRRGASAPDEHEGHDH